MTSTTTTGLGTSRRSFGRTTAAILALASCTGAALADRVLETSGGSLTNVLFTGSTPVQGFRPVHQQRGVGLDGSFRAGPALRWALLGEDAPRRLRAGSSSRHGLGAI